MGTAASTARVRSAVEKTFVRDLPERFGRQVTLHGWFVSTSRADSLPCLMLRDRTGTVLVILRGTDGSAEFDRITPESAIRVTGTVRTGASARFGAIEVEAESLEVLAPAEPLPDAEPLAGTEPVAGAEPLSGTAPLSGTERLGEAEPPGRADAPLPVAGRTAGWAGSPGSAVFADWSGRRHLDLRVRERFLVFEVQTTLEAAVREYLLTRRFIEIHTPKITPRGGQTDAPAFELSYFGAPARLARSPQAYLQLAMASGFDRAFEVGPAFRAETAASEQQASEFTRLDLAMSWIDGHGELMSVAEELVRHALLAVREAHGDDIERYCGVPVEVPGDAIPRLPLARALALTDRSGGDRRLSATDELALSGYAYERYGHSFLFLTDYPAVERPFSVFREDPPVGSKRPAGSRSFVLLGRGLELASGCQREHRYDRLRAQAAGAGAGEGGGGGEAYLDMFRHGCPPHGGFGIGLNRLLMALLGQPSIGETTFVLRAPGCLTP
jgi:aspartyl/asparaginyl-tRNA synthetase